MSSKHMLTCQEHELLLQHLRFYYSLIQNNSDHFNTFDALQWANMGILLLIRKQLQMFQEINSCCVTFLMFFFSVKSVFKFSDIICSHYYFLWLITLAQITNCLFRNVFFNQLLYINIKKMSCRFQKLFFKGSSQQFVCVIFTFLMQVPYRNITDSVTQMNGVYLLAVLHVYLKIK